jgi:hypothetical protein
MTRSTVFMHLYATEIKDYVSARSGVAPGDPEYIGIYAKMAKQYWAELSIAEQNQVEERTADWCHDGVPTELQHK